MEYNTEKVDEIVLALLHLNTFQDNTGYRAWKNLNWDALARLHEQGYIGNAKSKARSITLTEKGRQAAGELFNKHFGQSGSAGESDR